MKRVLITGETGYIARNLLAFLQTEGFSAECVSLRHGLPYNLADYDTVVHCAAVVHRQFASKREYYRVNTELTYKLATAFKRAGGQHFIFLSTMAVYGRDGNLHGREVIGADTETRPRGHYARSKLLAEMALRRLHGRGFTVAILRPPMVYGRHCPGNFAALRQIAAFAPVFPLVRNKRSMLHIGKLCGIIRETALEELGGTFHPRDSRPRRTSDIVAGLAQSQGRGLYLSGRLGRLVCMLDAAPVRKAFGSLTYDEELV